MGNVSSGHPQQPLSAITAPQAPGKHEKQYVQGVLEESRRFFDDSLDGWERIGIPKKGWSVYRKPVAGTELTMSRLEAEIPLRPDSLFTLLTSMDGKRIIDPFPREHHSKIIRVLGFPGGEANIVYSEAPRFYGILRPREYVTCDAEAKREKLFVCKSCKVPEGEHAATRRGRVRANLLFAMRMRPLEGQRGCHLQMINWLDLGGSRPSKPGPVPSWLSNFITEYWYFPALVRRLNEYTEGHGLDISTPPSQLAKLKRFVSEGDSAKAKHLFKFS